MRTKLPLLALLGSLLAAGCSSAPCDVERAACTMPDVANLSHKEAIAKLNAARIWKHPYCIGNPYHVDFMDVTSQQPPPNTKLSCDSVVDLIFYPPENKFIQPAPAPAPPPSPPSGN